MAPKPLKNMQEEVVTKEIAKSGYSNTIPLPQRSSHRSLVVQMLNSSRVVVMNIINPEPLNYRSLRPRL